MGSKSNKLRISNPEIRNLKSDSADLAAQAKSNLRFRISGFEILESFNFKISLPFISILFLLLLAIFAYSQDGTRTVWDGVYNEEQARRGQAAFLNQCANCHGRDLEGADMTPALTGGAFTANWDGLTIGDLADRIRISMPLNSPGTLSRQQTTDVIAYILQFNQFPAGKEELPREQPAQKQILFKARP
jgi:mono/diheme cytochrome c family protein